MDNVSSLLNNISKISKTWRTPIINNVFTSSTVKSLIEKLQETISVEDAIIQAVRESAVTIQKPQFGATVEWPCIAKKACWMDEEYNRPKRWSTHFTFMALLVVEIAAFWSFGLHGIFEKEMHPLVSLFVWILGWSRNWTMRWSGSGCYWCSILWHDNPVLLLKLNDFDVANMRFQ